MYPESTPKYEHNFDVDRVEQYMQKAKHILNDAEKGNVNKLEFLEARKRLWKFCEERGEDPRDYAMYHIMFGTPETLADWEVKNGIKHEDLPGDDSIANFIDSFLG
jgi:hypothetical protein